MILLDTHVVLWLTTDSGKLSNKARSAIEDARRDGAGLAICSITLLELAALLGRGRIQVDISLESFLEAVETRFAVLPISGRACAKTVSLPARYPKDPVDRIIGATALVEGLALVTADREIRRSKALQTIW